MSNGRYVQEFQYYFAEIMEPFQDEYGEDTCFWRNYTNFSSEQLLENCMKNRDLICNFLEKTPKAREKMRKKYDKDQWLALSIYAYAALKLGVIMLSRLDYHYIELSGSYRDCARMVAWEAIGLADSLIHFQKHD